MSIQAGFLQYSVTTKGRERKFVVYVPSKVAPKEGWPAILFLHGRGESGSDGLLQLVNGLMPAICRNVGDWPFLVVFPQKSDQDMEWSDEQTMIDEVLAFVDQHWKTDSQRRYLTGLSQGGRGTLRLAKRLSWKFAAIAAVCGWANPEVAKHELADTPVWLFHGEKDPVIPASESQAIYDVLEPVNSRVKLSLFPELSHNCWDEAYLRQGLPAWFLSHSLPPKAE